MKTCSHCKQKLPVEQFNANRSRPDGLSGYCKPCTKEANAKSYQQTKWKHNPARAETRRRRLEEIQEKLLAYLLAHPCVDCGETDPLVLQFDHQGDKEFDISASGKYTSWERIRREVEKCEVVCANDHQRRTAVTFRWWKLAALKRIKEAVDSEVEPAR